MLKAYGVVDRRVWAADSFEGLPPPNAEKYPHDAGPHFDHYRDLAVSIDEVRRNFDRYGLLDDQVRFLRDWFPDTLPDAPIEKLAILRLDGDLYESTMDALNNLYHRLSPGGYVIVDEYSIPPCKQAVHDFRQARWRTPGVAVERFQLAGRVRARPAQPRTGAAHDTEESSASPSGRIPPTTRQRTPPRRHQRHPPTKIKLA